MLSDFLREEFTRNPLRKLLVVFALPAIKAFKRRVDPRRYNGATLIGLRGIVVKSHGSADVLAFQHALQKAYAEAAHGVLERIARRHGGDAGSDARSPTAADAVPIVDA